MRTAPGGLARPRALLAGAVALLMCAPRPAVGAGEEPGDLGTVWVFARVVQPLVEVAATVTAVDASTVERELAQDLRDATRYTPGLSLPNDPARFGLATIDIRGIGGNRVLLETDGVPVPAGFAIGSYSNAGRPFTDLDLVSRIEIMRGPASALYGSDAIGGVVSTRTIAPADLLCKDDAALRVRSGYYSDDRAWRASLAGAVRGPADLEALVAWVRREGAELDNGSASIAPNPRDTVHDTVLARLVLAGMDNPLRLTVASARDGAVTLVNSDVLQPGRFANTTYLRGDDHGDSERVILEQSFLASAGPDQALWRAYWQRTRTDQGSFETRRAARPATPALEIARGFAFHEVTLGAQATAAYELAAGRTVHRLVFGGELARHDLDEQRDGVQRRLDTGAVTKVILGETLPLRDFPLTTQTQAGAYLQDEFRVRGGRVAWEPALRVDYYRLHPTVDALYANGNPGQAPVALSQASASPRLGATWAVADGHTLFAQYTHGFRSPPFDDVNIGLYLPQFNVRAIPNPSLKPEKSDGLELGWRSANASVAGSVSAFYTRYRDFIESKVNIGKDPATGITLFQSLNLARAAIWGVEAEGRLRPGAWRAQLAPWSVRYALAFASGDDLEHDRPLNSIDPARAVIGLAYDSAGGRWGGELSTTAVAAKRRVSDTPTPLVRTPGFVTIDLTAHWQASGRLALEAGLFNLTDRSYLEWADVRSRPAGDPQLDLYRRPGRNGSVSFAYRW